MDWKHLIETGTHLLELEIQPTQRRLNVNLLYDYQLNPAHG